MPLYCDCAVNIVNLGSFLQITVERQGLLPKIAIVSRFNLYIPFCNPTAPTECIPISQMVGTTDSSMVQFYTLCCHKWEYVVSFNYQCTINFTDTDGSTYSFTPQTAAELCAWLSQLPCAPNCAILPSVSAPTTVLSIEGVTLSVTDTHGTSNSTPCSTWEAQSVTATSEGGDVFDITGVTDLGIFFCGITLNTAETEQILTITSDVTDCGGSGDDTIEVPISVDVAGTVVAVNGVLCNVPIQPKPVLSLVGNQATITETGNCPDPNVVLYGYTITDAATNTVLFDKTAAASVADITNTLANLQSDMGLIVTGVNCPQTISSVILRRDKLDNVSQGGNVIMSGIDFVVNPNAADDLKQAILTYLAANGGTVFDAVTVTFDGTVITINIVSSVAGFTLFYGVHTVVFTETPSGVQVPCIGCYEITIYATPCDGSGDATVMGNSLFVTVVPFMHDGGDVYYFDGSPINVYSPFSNNLLGNGSTVQQIDDLLNNDPDKPAGVIFTGLTNSSDSSGSYEIAVGNACVNAPFIGVEPLPISLALVSQTGGQVLNGYVATNPYPTEYNFAYSSDGTNFTPQATWDAVSGNNISHDFGASVFGNGDYVRVCGRYVGGTAVWCEVIRIPTVAVSENINGNGDYVKTIFNQTPDTSRPDVFTDFIETLTISGHNDPAVNGSYVIEVNSTTVTATPALPAGLSIARINAHAIEVVATATFLADNTGSITIDETDIYGILKHSGDMDMQSVTAATETYSYSALFDCWVSPNIDQSALSFYRNIIVNGVTYNTATYTGSDITLYVAEVLSLGIAGLVNAAYAPKKITISFSSSAAITSVEFEADEQVGTFSVLPFTQTSANQPTSCV